jgi:NAD(P)-dependent dehydrogenase (short-subunit alcohol dehydrogenase family)
MRWGGYDWPGRQVLVTGAASGIGRATALLAASRGAHLHLVDIAAAGLEETTGSVRASGGTVLTAQPLDVTDFDAVRAYAVAVTGEHGALDVVMNVAGIARWGTISGLENDDWRALVEVNLMGPVHVLEAFVPPMVEGRRGGHVVNVS